MILVTGATSGGKSVELLYTNGSRICNLPDLPYDRYLHSQTGLTLCGGRHDPESTNCQTLSSTGSWEETHTLSMRRASHCAWNSPQGIILIGGWHTGNGDTTEILLENGDTNPGFNLDYAIDYACAIEESDSVIITGGAASSGYARNSVTRYTADGSSTSLPNMKSGGRATHACGLYTTSSNSIVQS